MPRVLTGRRLVLHRPIARMLALVLAMPLPCAASAGDEAPARSLTLPEAARAVATRLGSAAPAPLPAQDAPAPSEPSTTTADDRPGTRVSVSLDDGIFQQRLPFDVPFHLSGEAPAFATALSLAVFRTRTRTVLTDLVEQLRGTLTCEPESRFDVTAVSRSSWRTRGDAAQFTLLVNALDPQRYYVFCFISRGPVPPAEVDAAAREIVAQAALLFFGPQAAGARGDVGLELARNVHERLATRIEQLGAVRAIPAVIPEGNLLHRDTAVEPGRPFARLLSRIIEPYRTLQRAEAEHTARRQALQRALAEVPESARAFVSADVLGALAPAALPSRELAITSATPFDVSPHDLTEPVADLEKGETAARAQGDTQAAEALASVAEQADAVQGAALRFGRAYEALRDAAQQVMAHVALEAREVSVGIGSSVLTADLNRNAYVSLDTGMAYAWQLENMVFYAGTNIYFRPINKHAPLRLKGGFLRRFALTIGVTTTVRDTSRRAEDLRPSTGSDGTNSLLVGGGLRVTPSIRFGAGTLVFKERDPNPLITRSSVAATPYVSLAIDVNVGEALKRLFPGS